jgi:hypothetical protein
MASTDPVVATSPWSFETVLTDDATRWPVIELFQAQGERIRRGIAYDGDPAERLSLASPVPAGC